MTRKNSIESFMRFPILRFLGKRQPALLQRHDFHSPVCHPLSTEHDFTQKMVKLRIFQYHHYLWHVFSVFNWSITFNVGQGWSQCVKNRKYICCDYRSCAHDFVSFSLFVFVLIFGAALPRNVMMDINQDPFKETPAHQLTSSSKPNSQTYAGTSTDLLTKYKNSWK